MNPLGSSRAQFWDALRSGHSALRVEDASHPATAADGGKLAALLGKGEETPGGSLPYAAARVGDFGAAQAIDANRRRRMPRLGQMAIVAAQQAVADAATGRVDAAAASPVAFYGSDRVGVALGTALGALDLTVEFMSQYLSAGLSTASPASFPYTVLNTPAALIAMELGLRGPNVTVNHRDLSASEAFVTACELLLCGRADAVLAGGADELSLSLLHAYRRFSGLADVGSAAPLDAAPSALPPGPYDRRRRGVCPGEGATLFLLERADAAERRGAPVLARVAGYGRAGDTRARIGWSEKAAIDIQQDPGSSGAVSAVHAAATMAGCEVDQIDCIAGSGNGTRLDQIETAMLRTALGQAADRIAVMSVLGQTGEWPTSAASRMAQALFALQQQALPRFECPQPDAQAALPGLCTVSGDHREPIAASVQQVLVPCFAQGGGSVAIMLARA